MGRQHQRVDRCRLQQQSESSRRPSEMAEDCRRCQQWCPYDPDGSGTQVTGNNLKYSQLNVKPYIWSHVVPDIRLLMIKPCTFPIIICLLMIKFCKVPIICLLMIKPCTDPIICLLMIKSCTVPIICLLMIKSCTVLIICLLMIKSCTVPIICLLMIKSCTVPIICLLMIQSCTVPIICLLMIKSCTVPIICLLMIKSCTDPIICLLMIKSCTVPIVCLLMIKSCTDPIVCLLMIKSCTVPINSTQPSCGRELYHSLYVDRPHLCCKDCIMRHIKTADKYVRDNYSEIQKIYSASISTN